MSLKTINKQKAKLADVGNKQAETRKISHQQQTNYEFVFRWHLLLEQMNFAGINLAR